MADATDQERSLIESVIAVVDSGQRLLVDRLELMRWELHDSANRTARGVLLMAVGAALLGLAYVTLLIGAVFWLRQYLPLPASLALAAALTATLGGVAIGLGLRPRRSGDRAAPTAPPGDVPRRP